jgi:hypothetical protein
MKLKLLLGRDDHISHGSFGDSDIHGEKGVMQEILFLLIVGINTIADAL